MHDVTEGGLATALRELAVACEHGIVVHLERVPVLPETRRLCELLGVDPLGLIASGSLLVCCRPDETESLLRALADEGIAATVIGEVGERGAGVSALARGLPAPWPEFAADEAARMLAKRRAAPEISRRPRARRRDRQSAVSRQSILSSSQSRSSASRSSATRTL